ncbi:helix-turn-helix domain-containing protein [Nocardia sp. NPDC050630]|uniref:helix-turn-helix domain-containing protein n=1 Tax=Nocardia sp. NPDC050630 TaxID=3364321 RepID=UPI0037AE6522
MARPVYVPSPGRKRHLKQAEVDEIVARYRAGRHSTQLAKEHGLAKETVLKLLRANGVKIRRQGLSPEQAAEAEWLYT